MLGKLIKHEWKDTYKIGIILMSLIVGVTALGALYFQTPLWKGIWDNNVTTDEYSSFIFAISGLGSLFLYVIMLVGVSYGIQIYLGVHFYRTMYTDQGYLTQTLPVTPFQLLFSKLLVGGIWVLILGTMIGISLLILGASLIGGYAASQDIRLYDFQLLRELAEILQDEIGIKMLSQIFLIAGLFIVGSFMSIAIIFGAVTVGQLSRKHKGMMGIITYFGLFFVQSILNMLVRTCIMYIEISFAVNVSSMLWNTSYLSSMITSVILGVIMFFAAHYILKNNLNMD